VWVCIASKKERERESERERERERERNVKFRHGQFIACGGQVG